MSSPPALDTAGARHALRDAALALAGAAGYLRRGGPAEQVLVLVCRAQKRVLHATLAIEGLRRESDDGGGG